jgi:diguanylate cyclase (GGDEF)-like protein
MSLANRQHELKLLRQISDLSLLSNSRAEIALHICDLLADFFTSAVSAWIYSPANEGLRFVSKQPAIACPIELGYLKKLMVGKTRVARYDAQRSRIVFACSYDDQSQLIIVVDKCWVEPSEELLAAVISQAAMMMRASFCAEERWANNRPLELINAAAQVALDGDGLASFANNLVSFLAERFSCVLVSLHLLDVTKAKLTVVACASANPFSLAIDQEVSARVGEEMDLVVGIVGRACRLAEPQLVNDVRADPNYIEFDRRVSSEYAVPIMRRGQVLGVLNLESERSDVFDGEAQLMLRTLADHAAGPFYFAMVNERLNSQHLVIAEREQALQRTNDKLRRANESLRRLSMADGLTGVANRRAFAQHLRSTWREQMAQGGRMCLVMSDLDYFKHYNDGYGHLAGDDALRLIAKSMQRFASAEDAMVARYGGEEFALLLPNVPQQNALQIAERQRLAVAKLGLSCNGKRLTLSSGVASLVPTRGCDPETLIAMADHALYQAKARGRNCVAHDGLVV